MGNNENSRSYELDIRRICTVLWRRAWALLLAGVFLATIAFGYAWFFVTPAYASGVKIYVNNFVEANYGAYSPAQLTGAQQLAKTYMVILESRPVLEQVQEKTGLQYTQKQIKAMITAEAINETEVFQIVVTCGNSKHAAMIAEAFAEVLPETIAQVVEGSSIRVVEHAVENPDPIGPNYQMYTICGALAGIVLCAAVIILFDMMDMSIDSEEYLTSNYENVPLLAVIPHDETGKNSYYKGYHTTGGNQ